MALIETDCISNHNQHIYTFTQPAETANEFASKMSRDLLKKTALDYAEWVSVGDFFPVIWNGELHYTFTITTGLLI